MAVVGIYFLEVLHPLHNASVRAEGRGLESAQGGGETIDEGTVLPQGQRSFACRGEELAQYLVVHR